MIPSRDHTGLPIHFHSSMISRSASRMLLRMLANVLPRQSVSPAISRSIRSDGSMGSPSRLRGVGRAAGGLDAELLCVLGVQSLPAAELHRLATNDAADGSSAEKLIQNIETNVPPGSAHRDEAAVDVVPQRQA